MLIVHIMCVIDYRTTDCVVWCRPIIIAPQMCTQCICCRVQTCNRRRTTAHTKRGRARTHARDVYTKNTYTPVYYNCGERGVCMSIATYCGWVTASPTHDALLCSALLVATTRHTTWHVSDEDDTGCSGRVTAVAVCGKR